MKTLLKNQCSYQKCIRPPEVHNESILKDINSSDSEEIDDWDDIYEKGADNKGNEGQNRREDIDGSGGGSEDEDSGEGINRGWG